MNNLFHVINLQNEIIELQASAIDEMMTLLARYLDLEETEQLSFYDALDEANQYRKEIDM